MERRASANIVSRDCAFTFEFRNLVDVDQQAIADRIIGHARDVLQPAMRTVDLACGIAFEEIDNYPAMPSMPGIPSSRG